MLFILGAGASVDSGLKTYRGTGGLYDNSFSPEKILNRDSFKNEKDFLQMWNFLRDLYRDISLHSPGRTYSVLSELTTGDDLILTQNIDSYVNNSYSSIIEIHGNYKTVSCLKCGSIYDTPEIVFSASSLKIEDLTCNRQVKSGDLICKCGGKLRPQIVLFGESLSNLKVNHIYTWLRKQKPKWIIVIGTSLQFPYLRAIINKAKGRGAKVIHINPDPNYIFNVRSTEFWLNNIDSLQEFLENKQKTMI